MKTPHFYCTPLRRLAHTLADPKLTFLHKSFDNLLSTDPVTAFSESEPPPTKQVVHKPKKSVEISHQWAEWTELLELLFKKGYLNVDALDGHKNSNLIRSACLDFARDRVDLIRYFSRKDIHVMAGAGCPSLDRKVVNSGKRLRAHVGIDEGDVCSSCNLRGGCERAYVKAREDENGRTVDIMRYLLTFGLDLNTGSITKNVKESVRKLMKDIVEFSDKEFSSSDMEATNGCSKKLNSHQMPNNQKKSLMKQGDWICPKCNFMNFAKNFKCLRCAGVFQERLDKLREEHEHLPLKKGDWICEKCYFLNFAKNTKCLQCDEKPPKRNLNPGEWECESCNYINFRKNMVCLKCNWKRPKASSKHSGISFVRDSDESSTNHYPYKKCSSEELDANFWSCEEDETDEDNDQISLNKFAENFPIAGGSSVISKDVYFRERWKEEMSRNREMSLNGMKANVNEMDFSVPVDLEYDDCENDDADDIAGWFRKKNGY